MANYKGPTEGGSGGKRGHSSMEHWTFTEELKDSSKVQRRIDSKSLSKQAISAQDEQSLCDECGSTFTPSKSAYVGLCPECAHWIYGSPACNHEFLNNKCSHCGWDGSVSKYVESIKTNANE